MPGIACLLSAAPVWAEPQRLALPQAVESALRNNGELKSFREEKGVHEAGKTRAGLLPNPTLEIEGTTGALTGSSAESVLSLGVSQEFPLSGKRQKRLALAERELEIYRWQLADRERLLRLAVETAYYELVLAEQRIALADRAIALNRQLLELSRERLAQGDIPELEMNLVKVELARSAGFRIDMVRAHNQNRVRLLTLTGLSAGEAAVAAEDFQPEGAPVKSLAELKQLAQQARPDLKALAAEVGRGDSDVALAGAEAIPNVTAGLSFTRDATSIEVGGMEGRDTAYVVGVKLSMPIPLFDRNQAGVQEARARRSSAQSRLAAAGKTVDLEVETAYAGLRNAEQLLSLYRTGVIPQLKENLELTREAYRLGEVGVLNLIEEQKKFIEVDQGYLTALHGRQSALSMLAAAVAADITGGVQ